MDADTPLPLEFDGVDRFFTCPHCWRKNLVIAATSSAGVPALKLARIKT